MSQIPKTVPLYWSDTYLTESTAHILEITPEYIVFDRTIFHPQGGGQPADTGEISTKDGEDIKITISDVKMRDEIVYHYGNFQGVPLNIGDEVTLKIDSEKRRLHARLHSAGHLIGNISVLCAYFSRDLQKSTWTNRNSDKFFHSSLILFELKNFFADVALQNIGWKELEPGKGYHFADGPYVEYIGAIPAEKRQGMLLHVSANLNKSSLNEITS